MLTEETLKQITFYYMKTTFFVGILEFFTKKHILETEGKAKELKANYILTTEKDWIRIKELDPEFPFIVIDIGIQTVDEPRLILSLIHI